MSNKSEDQNGFHYGLFPKGFHWGMSTSAYQVEGAWNEDGKGENVWDRFIHEDPKRIQDLTNGDEASDSYHKYKDDVKALKDMGANMYRFSISWARVLPKGTIDQINQPGVDYYNNLINELLANGIQPMITLFHWDMPQTLQEIGGVLNEEMIEIFGEYARFCFDKFGDRVKYWITINEPYIYAWQAYHLGIFPPGIEDPWVSPYLAVHSILKIHAATYHIYKQEFFDKQGGKVGMTIDTSYYGPMNPDSKEDIEAADRAYQFRIGFIAHPLYYGEYPPVMREFIDRKSKNEGRPVSRLPTFSPEWSAKIKGSMDFFGLNYYTGELVEPFIQGVSVLPDHPWGCGAPGWNRDLETLRIDDPKGKQCGAFWQRDCPYGLRHALKWVKDHYDNPEVIITENGMADTSYRLDDEDRVQYFKGHINETLKAIDIDGCNVRGYMGWSLLDSFEWSFGYMYIFGVHYIDPNCPDKKRSPKNSAKYLATVFKNNGFIKQ